VLGSCIVALRIIRCAPVCNSLSASIDRGLSPAFGVHVMTTIIGNGLAGFNTNLCQRKVEMSGSAPK
jgi:hypothetical protein